MIHPVESASPSHSAGIQQGEDEAQRRRWAFYEAVNVQSLVLPGIAKGPVR
jgi:hypothetical protein